MPAHPDHHLLIRGGNTIPKWAEVARHFFCVIEEAPPPVSPYGRIIGVDGTAAEVVAKGQHFVSAARGPNRLSQRSGGRVTGHNVQVAHDELPVKGAAPRARHSGVSPPGSSPA